MSQNLLSKPVHPQRYLSIVCDKKENVNFTAREDVQASQLLLTRNIRIRRASAHGFRALDRIKDGKADGFFC